MPKELLMAIWDKACSKSSLAPCKTPDLSRADPRVNLKEVKLGCAINAEFTSAPDLGLQAQSFSTQHGINHYE